MFFKPEDFTKQWQDQTRQWQEQMEKIFVEKINEMIRNPALLSAVSKSIETSFDSKQKANETIAEFLQKLNVPTRHDTGRIMQYLQQVEARVLDLDEKLDLLLDRVEKLQATSLAQPSIPRAATPAPKNPGQKTVKIAAKKTATRSTSGKGRK
ncbi:MAG TPA: hypothetical protein PKO06_01140 [Candidatus Ozemobacteraceae bacterium]|nr:hypothetical protein [Candidatus Ozemobacteraceae bacterium]